MNFQKCSKVGGGGGGGHFQSKTLCCSFWILKQGILDMKKCNMIFENEGRGGAGVEGSLELYPKNHLLWYHCFLAQLTLGKQ